MGTLLGLIIVASAIYGVRWLFRVATTPTPGASPSPRSTANIRSTDPTARQQRREDEAFVDGMFIGSYFFGDFWEHNRERSEAAEDLDDEPWGDDELDGGGYYDDYGDMDDA